MTKTVKYSLAILALLLIVYFSLDIKRLDSYKAGQKEKVFNASDYALAFWNDSLPVCIDKAQPISTIVLALTSDAKTAFPKYGHKLGISKIWYFLAKCTGIIDEVSTESIVVKLDDGTKVLVATDFIFGNAIRDGSGKVNINEFTNMTDFNAVSVQINRLAKTNVASPLKTSATTGMKIEFAAAAEINEESTDFASVIWIPVSIKLSDGSHE